MKMTYIIRLIVIFVSKQTKWWSQHVIYTQADFFASHPTPPLFVSPCSALPSLQGSHFRYFTLLPNGEILRAPGAYRSGSCNAER